MVYGRYNELVNGVYKPTYNWGAPSCKEPQNNDTTIPYRFPPVASPREPWDFPLKKQHHRRGKSMVFTMVFDGEIPHFQQIEQPKTHPKPIQNPSKKTGVPGFLGFLGAWISGKTPKSSADPGRDLNPVRETLSGRWPSRDCLAPPERWGFSWDLNTKNDETNGI